MKAMRRLFWTTATASVTLGVEIMLLKLNKRVRTRPPSKSYLGGSGCRFGGISVTKVGVGSNG